MSFLVRKIKLSKWTKFLKFEITEGTIEYLRTNVVGITDDTLEKLKQLVGIEYSDETEFFQDIGKKIGRKKLDQCNKQLRASATKPSSLQDNQIEALKADLKSDEGRVSFWICDGSPAKRDQVVLALMTADNKQDIESLEIVLVPLEMINANGLPIKEVKGATVIDELRSRHRDVILENDTDHGKLIDILIFCICEQWTSVYTHNKIKEIIRSAIQEGMLDVARLHEKMRNKLI